MTTTAAAAEYPRRIDPQQIAVQWAAVARCPACGAADGTDCGLIPDRFYVFGAEQVPLPDAGIPVTGCDACGLVYKSTVPAPAFLTDVFGRQAAARWTGPHDFSVEAATLRRLMGRNEFDLLDAGAAGGAFLDACAASGVVGRRSALDVMRYPGIETRLAGEFIEGFLDDPSLNWEGEPYDAVTLLDVLEHLYQPRIAFENLRSLVKRGGLVFIATGNADSFWPRHFGASQWWYVRLIEHHIFWSRRPLERIAAAHGFEIVFWEEVRHRTRRNIFRSAMMAELLKVGLYFVATNYYSEIARIFHGQGNQPWHPFARDHFQACLRKK
jgi:2-polyprenyl-3-methyl-5-hydroxy-6-metoxy-1,4-benzoquinol methylase